MRGSILLRSSGWRRRVLTMGFVAGGLLIVASVAYACILRTGTILVCSPPSRTFTGGTDCSKANGSGGQSGLARFSDSGGLISVKVRNMTSAPYSLHFRAPSASSSCTGHNGTTTTSLLGTDAEGKPVTVNGPKFYREVTTPAVDAVGRAQVCAVQQPRPTTAQTVNVTVI